MSRLTKLEKRWILYDVGNSAFTMLVSTIIPIYFKSMAAESGVSMADSTAYWGYAVSVATILTALLGPVVGTLADTKGYKKPLFTLSMMMGVLGCAALGLPTGRVLLLAVFVIAKAGFNFSLIFYDSMLVDVSPPERMDYVSSQGYAWGYIGSCIPFTASLLLVLFAEQLGLATATATGIAFVGNAVWWLLVTLPLLKSYEQTYYVEKSAQPLRASVRRIVQSIKGVRMEKKTFLFLLAFFFYIDGVYTIIEMATSYGMDVGITQDNLLLALLLTQIVAFPCSIWFGRMSKKYRTESLIKACIIGYFGIALFALQLDKAWEFWVLAVWVAVFQGAIQALSRSYFAKIIPKEKSSEYFGFFDIFGKGASFLGTMLMGVSTQLSGSSKTGVALLAVMFVVGYVLFCRAARAPEETQA